LGLSCHVTIFQFLNAIYILEHIPIIIMLQLSDSYVDPLITYNEG
jgi:hypothetical protein